MCYYFSHFSSRNVMLFKYQLLSFLERKVKRIKLGKQAFIYQPSNIKNKFSFLPRPYRKTLSCRNLQGFSEFLDVIQLTKFDYSSSYTEKSVSFISNLAGSNARFGFWDK